MLASMYNIEKLDEQIVGNVIGLLEKTRESTERLDEFVKEYECLLRARLDPSDVFIDIPDSIWVNDYRIFVYKDEYNKYWAIFASDWREFLSLLVMLRGLDDENPIYAVTTVAPVEISPEGKSKLIKKLLKTKRELIRMLGCQAVYASLPEYLSLQEYLKSKYDFLTRYDPLNRREIEHIVEKYDLEGEDEYIPTTHPVFDDIPLVVTREILTVPRDESIEVKGTFRRARDESIVFVVSDINSKGKSVQYDDPAFKIFENVSKALYGDVVFDSTTVVLTHYLVAAHIEPFIGVAYPVLDQVIRTLHNFNNAVGKIEL